MTKRSVCARCARPPAVCYCQALPPQALRASATRVVVLQHERERRQRQALSSVPVLTRVLACDIARVVVVPNEALRGPTIAGSTIRGGEGGEQQEEEEHRTLDALLAKELAHEVRAARAVLVMYPHASARRLDAALMRDLHRAQDDDHQADAMRQPLRTATTVTKERVGADQHTLLIAVDGTWPEAKKIVHYSQRFWTDLRESCHARGALFSFVCLSQPPLPSSSSSPSSSSKPPTAGEQDGGARHDEVQMAAQHEVGYVNTTTTTASSSNSSSIYGELRKEPMAGCLSTLEAIGEALRVLEPGQHGGELQEALCRAFRAMVTAQHAFQMRGRALALNAHGGVPKPTSKRRPTHDRANKAENDCDASSIDTSQEEARRRTDQLAPCPRGVGVVKQYIFFTTHRDLRHRVHYEPQGELRVCTRDEAVMQCRAMNQHRPRGQRVSTLPLEAYERQRMQLQEQAQLEDREHRERERERVRGHYGDDLPG